MALGNQTIADGPISGGETLTEIRIRTKKFFEDRMSADLYLYLIQVPAVKNLLGDRIFPETAPQGTPRPFAIVSQDDEDGSRHMGGQGSLVNVAIRIEITAESAPIRKRASDAIREALDGMTHKQKGETLFRSITQTNKQKEYIDPSDASGEGDYKEILRFSIWYHRREIDIK